MTRRSAGGVAAALILVTNGLVWAGGYDTPMLYSARHMGMGGAAAAYVDDPSALFHNPAGLAQIERLSLLGDFSLLVGGLSASPSPTALDVESNAVIAPFFLLGGGVRLTDFLVVGAAVYPVASASASYDYRTPAPANAAVEDSTKLIFIETTAGAAVNIDAARLRLGAGYRLTFVSLARAQKFDDKAQLDVNMTGWNFAGFRVGAQWDAIPRFLSFGVSYRHKTVTEVTQDEFTVYDFLGGTATDGRAEFTLPGRLIFGVRGDYGPWGAAADLEYAFNSQNDATSLSGTASNTEITLANVFEWDDAITLRLGAEYRFLLGPAAAPGSAQRSRAGGPASARSWKLRGPALIPRLGFVYDAKTSQKKYPTAFGTPPTATFVLTGGLGYERGNYRANLAYAYRFGSTTITPEDLRDARTCDLCGKQGDYKLFLNGFYVDFSYEFN